MSGNIDSLLEKLPQGSLAYELVCQLKKSKRDEWPAVLEAYLKAILKQKVEELEHGKDQAARN